MNKTHHHHFMIVMALEAEAKNHFDDLPVVFCGVGKVNASYHLTRHLARHHHEQGQAPRLVVNVGSAGSTHFPRGSLVNCTRFIQRDMNVDALGFSRYATPFDATPAVLGTGLRYHPLPEGICGSGDSFVTDGVMTDWNVADMEGFALAKVCHHENIPFCSVKYITDGADETAPLSWEEALDHAARALRVVTNDILTAFAEGD